MFLSNLTAVDRELHFEVVYHLQSLDRNHMLQVKARVTDREDPALPSLTGVTTALTCRSARSTTCSGSASRDTPICGGCSSGTASPGYPLRKDFLQMPGQVRAGLPGFPHESEENAWPVPGSVPQRPMHPNDPQPEGELVVAEEGEESS